MRIESLPDYMLANYRADAVRKFGPGSFQVRVIDDEIERRKSEPKATALSLPVTAPAVPIVREPLRPFVADPGPVWGVLGLDPGRYSGAVALMLSTGEVICVENGLSGNETGASIDPLQHELFAGISFPCFAFLELITPVLFRRDKETGEKKQVSPDSSLMQHAGALAAALECYRLPYRRVRAVTWQTFMGCRSAGRKIVTRDRARALIGPRYNGAITHRNADALLIADFGRRIITGEFEVKSWGKQKVLKPWEVSRPNILSSADQRAARIT